MSHRFLVIASMGSSGTKWLEEMLMLLPPLHVARWIPGLPPEYKKTIELNPMLRRVDMQNHSLRTLMPIDCLFEEVLRVCPPSPLYVVSHFHYAQSLQNNYQKYPSRIPHRLAYLYSCPIKSMRSAIKNQLHYTTQGAVNEEALRREVEVQPKLLALIAQTEKHFNMTLSDMQRIGIARHIFRTLAAFEDLQLAQQMGARMLHFESLKQEPMLMQALLDWASDGDCVPELPALESIYAGSGDLAKYHYEGYKFADENQDALIAAPYDGEAIWNAMSDWQRYFFRETIKLLPVDYVDFYALLGVELDYLKTA